MTDLDHPHPTDAAHPTDADALPRAALGWDPRWAYYLESLDDDGLVGGRVVAVDRDRCRVITDAGPSLAYWRHPLPVVDGGDIPRPAVGDWAAVRLGDGLGRVEVLLPRRTALSRGRASGPEAEQVIAANVDEVLVLMGLDGDYNLRRVERYLALIRASGAQGLVVLSKADLCTDLDARLAEVRGVARATEVMAISALEGHGMDRLEAEITPQSTVLLVGSSGAGKSTLLNRLLGADTQATQTTRHGDDSGRHTTTRRALFALPNGALVIDTPGIRAVGLTGDADVDDVFPEIAEWAEACRFADCGHDDEPGCAVRAAVGRGDLDAGRLDGYLRLRVEQVGAERRQNTHAQRSHDRATIGKYRELGREARRFKGDH